MSLLKIMEMFLANKKKSVVVRTGLCGTDGAMSTFDKLCDGFPKEKVPETQSVLIFCQLSLLVY